MRGSARIAGILLLALAALRAPALADQALALRVPADAPSTLHGIAVNLCMEPDPKRNLEATTCIDCQAKAALPQPGPGLRDLQSLAATVVDANAEAARVRRDLAALEYIDARDNIGLGQVPRPETAASIREQIKERNHIIAQDRARLALIEANIQKSTEHSQMIDRVGRGELTAEDLAFLTPHVDSLSLQTLIDVDFAERQVTEARENLALLRQNLELRAPTENPGNASDLAKLRKRISQLEEARIPALIERRDTRAGESARLKRWKNDPGSPENRPSPWMIEALKNSVLNSFSINPSELAYLKRSLPANEKLVRDWQTQLEHRESEDAKIGDATARLALIEARYGNHLESFRTCGLTVAEAAALLSYTQAGYKVINPILRKGGPDAVAAQPYIETLESALKKIKPYQGYVTRGVDLPEDRLKDHEVGAVLTYPGLTSTSLGTPHFAKQKHQFMIRSKTGRFVGYHSQYLDEYEVLFPTGTKFKILARQPRLDGKIDFVMEEVD